MKVNDTVLVVDDDLTFLKTVGDTLSDGYDVSLASSGEKARELIDAGYVPDIILLDIDMPGMDGYETLNALREYEDMRDVPVVFLTAMTMPESEIKGLDSGAVDYITKPFLREILIARLKRHLDNGRRLRQLSITEKNKLEDRIDEEKFEQAAIDLTVTERKILRLIALGYTNREICEALNYSYGYVKKVAVVIYEKKFVTSRSELKKLLKQ